MTKLENDHCEIEITIDNTHDTESSLSKKYDIVINVNDRSLCDYYKVYSIRIRLPFREYSVAMIGDYNCSDNNCAVIDNDILTVLQGWEITQFDIRTAQVTRTVKVDSWAPNFEIFRIKTGYLIYGETDITLLNQDLEKQWSFMGRDIFVSPSDKNPFEIKSDRICIYDFEDNYYELDFQGNVIRCDVADN